MAQPHSQATVDRCKLLTKEHSYKTVAEIVGVSLDAIVRMKKRGWKAGTGRKPPTPMPGDYPIQRHHMRRHEAAKHYGVSPGTVRKWDEALPTPREYRREHKPVNKIAIPRDIKARVRELGATGAARHYGINTDTFRRMRRDVGLPIQKKRKNVVWAPKPRPRPRLCKRGHAFSISNTIRRADGTRNCKACVYAARKKKRDTGKAKRIDVSRRA
jgi:transposase